MSTMRISDLSRSSGVPIPTIKFYLREGLLPSGTPTGRNQARYDERHLRRLRLVRVLVGVGALSVARTREVLRAVDDPAVPVHEMLAIAHTALGPPPGAPADAGTRVETDAFLETLGWQVAPASPARDELATALDALRALGWDVTAAGVFRRYAVAIDPVAAAEVAFTRATPDRADQVERAVVGTVVFDGVLSALRRLAQEHHSSRADRAAKGDDVKPLT